MNWCLRLILCNLILNGKYSSFFFVVVEIFAVVLLILKAFDCEGEHNCELFASILILKLAVDIYLALKIFTSVRNC